MKKVPETLVVRNQDVETKAKGNAKGVEEAVVVEEGAAAVIYIWVVIRPKNGQHCPKRRNSVFKMEGQLPQQLPIINLSAPRPNPSGI